jgi:hypothetical protein
MYFLSLVCDQARTLEHLPQPRSSTRGDEYIGEAGLWYILGTTAIELVLIGLLDLPFRPGRRRAKRRGAAPVEILKAGPNQPA